ncbi:hypothetical protein PF008_g17900 [Phytophthora fragariae]|uniref:Uncharacterized protein n=2 Tax=Phytophthora fragariae TaxID=53985 RepID=A0A6G0R818_9STRA|nr:hypothetical protein PF008_g17900 [Phytophthora fragariae]
MRVKKIQGSRIRAKFDKHQSPITLGRIRIKAMRLASLRWTEALVLLAALQPIEPATLKFNNHVAVSLASNGTSFIASSRELPRDLLMTQFTDKKTTKKKIHKIADSNVMVEEDMIMCSQDPAAVYDGEIDVLLLFSKCLESSTLATVETWALDMQKIVEATVGPYDGVALTFKATMVAGSCSKTAYDTGVLVTGDDLDRVAAFPGLGDVYPLDSVMSSTDGFTAVISFATDETSYGEIVSFESVNQIANVVNFQLSGSGENCEGGSESCIELKDDEDLFMYNPFTVTQSLNCADLENGVPVTLVGDDGTRQCFCGCPAGYEMKTKGSDKACVKVGNASSCVWSKVGGYKHQVSTKSSVCSFDHIVDKWGIPLPLPTSGYGSSKLLLLLADGSLDPHIRVSAVKIQDPEYYAGFPIPFLGSVQSAWPLKFSDVTTNTPSAAKFDPMYPSGEDLPIHDAAKTWKDYQSNRAEAVNSIVFKDYGKYRVEMDAYDYYSSATCTGCIAILDNYRPRATTKCPASFCDSMSGSVDCGCTAELTLDSMAKANALVQQYIDFGDQADNDGCSGNNRCDLHLYTKKNFFEPKYTRYSHDESISCFDSDLVLGDMLYHQKITVNPLKKADGTCLDVVKPVAAGQCTRCCKMTTALREFWTNYRCGSDYDARYCDGDSDQSCTFEQCLVVNGDTLATVSARIKPDIVEDSKKVLQQLHEEDYQTVTQVHRALECTSYYGDDGQCVYMAKLSELVETTQTLNFQGDFDVNSFVHWRFKVNGDSEKWQLWKTRRQTSAETGCHWASCEAVYDNDDVLTFSDPETKISIEAWTQCGLVRSFFFYVHLHVNSAVDVCKHFGDMWYQTSVSRLPIAAQMCAYPGSDFAELTFDFHPNTGLQYSRTQLRMKVSEVVCTGTLEDRTPVEILKVAKDSPEIVTRFGVEMLHTPSTEDLTNFDVSCDFTYLDYTGAAHTKTCGRSFSIADCKGPQFDLPNAKCEYDACAGKEKAGLYEACGGKIIRSTKTSTFVDSGEKECCQGCAKTKVVCTGLMDVPETDAELMRCEPASVGGAYSNYYFPVSLLAGVTHNHPVAMLLLSGGVMTVAVTLVALHRRRTDLSSAQFDSDAYLPLLS